MADPDYIYRQSDIDLFEGPFLISQHKFARSLEKRGRALAQRLSPPRARLRERIVEIPLTIAALSRLPAGAPVADIGGASSLLALQLAYLGLRVQVIDLRPYPLRHPNLAPTQLDLFDNQLPPAAFAAISCISVIEHVGLARYGGAERLRGDLDFIRELRRLCQPAGKIILSAPYGLGHDPAAGPPHGYRVYDRPGLERLCQNLTVRQLRFFAIRDGVWLEVTQDEAASTPATRPINALFWAELINP